MIVLYELLQSSNFHFCLAKRKRKRSDPIKRPHTNRKFIKASDNTNFDYTTNADRLRTVSWSNDTYPTGVVKSVNWLPSKKLLSAFILTKSPLFTSEQIKIEEVLIVYSLLKSKGTRQNHVNFHRNCCERSKTQLFCILSTRYVSLCGISYSSDITCSVLTIFCGMGRAVVETITLSLHRIKSKHVAIHVRSI